MQPQSLFMEGVDLLVLGMGFVFIFLIFLVYATNVMSALACRFAPPPPELKNKVRKLSPKTISEPQDLIAVLTAAVHHHRNKNKTVSH
jgi:oxaloacetate decarboxylase (Na+ extruding) subunit gamma